MVPKLGPLWSSMTEIVRILEDGSTSRTLSFSDSSSRFFSRPWSVSRLKWLIWTRWDHNFGRETAEKRLDLNTYTGRMMIHKLKRLLSELLDHGLASIDV